jgi:hypothetical protein
MQRAQNLGESLQARIERRRRNLGARGRRRCKERNRCKNE